MNNLDNLLNEYRQAVLRSNAAVALKLDENITEALFAEHQALKAIKAEVSNIEINALVGN